MADRHDAEQQKLIEATSRVLKAESKDGSDLAKFASALFYRGAAEDVIQYTASELALMAETAYRNMYDRKAGKASVKVFNASPKGDEGNLGSVTAIEIINDNMPFLVDSVMGELQESGLDIRLVLHPILWVKRDNEGHLAEFLGPEKPDGRDDAIRESVILFHVERIESLSERDDLAKRLSHVLSQVRLSVKDWKNMRERLEKTVLNYKNNPPSIPIDETAEAIQFIEWMLEDNFTFLGMREYDFLDNENGGELKRTSMPGLGILSDPDVRVLRKGSEYVTFTPELLEFLKKPEPLIVTKANVKSMVHRRTHMDYVGVKLFNEEGQLTGELRIVGLFSATAYTRSTRRIPYIRRKIDKVIEKSGYDTDSHSGRVLLNVLESYPRDEMFQLEVDTLFSFAMAVMQLNERPRVRVLPRLDKFDRFVSILTFVPRERFTTEIRMRVGEYFGEVYNGRLSAWYVTYPEGPLVRVHFIVGREQGKTPVIPQKQLETDVSNIIRTWADKLRFALSEGQEPIRAKMLYNRYVEAFAGAYRESFAAETAVEDILRIERLADIEPLSISFRPREGAANRCDLKLYHLGRPIPLTERLPIIENMGFNAINERTYRVERKDDKPVWIHDILLERSDGEAIDFEKGVGPLEACFMAVWTGQAENDGFNALVVRAGIPWRDVAMLRAMSRYLRQAGITFSQDYLWETMNNNLDISRNLVELFHSRLDPARDDDERETMQSKIMAVMDMLLEDVSSLDEDRILRRTANVINNTLRTNFFQIGKNGLPAETFAFKLEPRKIEGLPEPRPLREIFVYSPRLEGVHLRFGMIARGGLRWSDRPQDFRTEVLGLVKAQQVKNAVIVPFGAKGGFVPKQLPPRTEREAFMEEGIASYKLFISSLLDVTDNLDIDTIVPPQQVVRHDGDDPYLVVAADKGTATFSDIANSISQSRDFWMDDAFASGGSAGYDHKKMGITARGAWEAVKRHFREMDKNIQEEPFTVVGVGDMSGDVFGNGMLLSPAIKLVAAFDHRDIFIDPDPDPETTFAERKRLFEMGRSSWQDYNKELISRGGGIYPRNLKSIKLEPEAREALEIKAETVTPQELMTAILKADADLMWFGGIGTYIRASGETDAAAGDKANDSIRITAKDLRVKVVGEGANLGMTQKARIEFARKGGRINTDAIDNSAGVNSSDMEVNIKIALGVAERAGKLDRETRNELLASMTEEVAELVLRNNYLQTLSLSLTEKKGRSDTGFQAKLMHRLEDRGLLDREVEFLPDDATLAEREAAGEGLTRPELAVLMAYAKISLFDNLLLSEVPDDAYLGRELYRYFPKPLHETYNEEIDTHRLRREIIATMLSNSIINRGGLTLIRRIADTTGAESPDIAFAFAAVRDSYGMSELNNEIDALDNKISGDLQLELYEVVQNLLVDRIGWFLKNTSPQETGLATIVDHFREGLEAFKPALSSALSDIIRGSVENKYEAYKKGGVPDNLAHELSMLPVMALVPDLILVRDRTGRDPADIATVYFKVSALFTLGRIDEKARSLRTDNYYDRLALERARESISQAWRSMAAEAIETEGGFEAWRDARADRIERTLSAVNDILEAGTLTVSKLTVAAGLLGDLAG
jgi:glutamate dehydrogenase